MNPEKGGPSQGIRNTIPALQELGIQNDVVCLDKTNDEFLKGEPFNVFALGGAFGAWEYNSFLYKWLLSNLGRYDAVIVHGLWLYHSIAALKAVDKCRKLTTTKVPRIYVMPHGMLDPYFQKSPRRKLKAIRNFIYWKIIENKVIKNANGIFFTSEKELQLARQSFRPYTPKAEFNVGYGVKSPPKPNERILGTFISKFPQLQNNSYLLFLSRIHPKKGVDLLLKAYVRLQQTHRDIPDLVIAGPGLDDAYGQELLELAKNNSQIHFTGMLQGDVKWGALYNCEAFVLPSHQENFGIAVVEALACEKPVLISDQVNIWQEIQEGNAGIITTDDEEGTFLALCTWVQMLDNEKQNMSIHAKEVYLKNFTIERAAEKLKAVLLAN